MSRGTRRVGLIMIALMSALIAAGPLYASHHAPGQFIAKMYSEALGRAPDISGWLGRVSYFTSNGCKFSTLHTTGLEIYTSSEFLNLGYNNGEKLLTLYRGVLNREPDSASFQTRLNLLNSGTTWSSMVSAVFTTTEFVNQVNTICAPHNDIGYQFGATPVNAVLPVSGTGFHGGTGAQLQALINNTGAGGTVWLAPHAIVRISTPLNLKAGVRLATYNLPNVRHYARQARLVRQSNFSGPLVIMKPNSKLVSVWVTGQRPVYGFNFDAINIRIPGGGGTLVDQSRIENPSGATNLSASGTAEGTPCGGTTLRGNLVTSYASSHYNQLWTDGFTVACENALIENNHVIDATDVPIIIFRAHPAVQKSIARNNTILNAGNSAYGGLAFDNWQGSYNANFTGAVFQNNLIWTGPYAHYDVAISLGTRPWFGNAAASGFGGRASNNTSGASKINVDTGIAVSGMHNATVQGNTLDTTHVNSSACPNVDIAVALAAGHGSGNIQTPWVNTDVSNCVHH